VRLDGWNFVPRGYELMVEARGGPLWLRILLRASVVDRFGYPLAVRRGVFVSTHFRTGLPMTLMRCLTDGRLAVSLAHSMAEATG
jgi:hypothetical protein